MFVHYLAKTTIKMNCKSEKNGPEKNTVVFKVSDLGLLLPLLGVSCPMATLSQISNFTPQTTEWCRM